MAVVAIVKASLQVVFSRWTKKRQDTFLAHIEGKNFRELLHLEQPIVAY